MMKRHSAWLALSATLTFGAVGSASAASVICEPTKLSFRTTEWLNPFDFFQGLADGTFGKAATTVVDGVPVALPLPAAGGTLSQTLEVPPGFRIKKVLVCAQAAAALPLVTAIPDLQVRLSQNLPAPSSPRTLVFQRMALSAPSCAVYRVVDDSGTIATSVDPRLSPTTLSILTPAGAAAEITGIGLRLQAVADSRLWTFVPYHQHLYRTGRGVGHNNTLAVTSGPSDECLDDATLFAADGDDVIDFTPDLPSTDATGFTPGGKGKGKGKNK